MSSGNAYYPTQTVQKELAAAVLENGGLEDVDLKVLCDEYPLLFGPPSTKKRRGVGGKVRDWKSKPHTFERFLRRNGTSDLLLSAVGNTYTTGGTPPTRPTPPSVPDPMLSSRVKTRSQSRSPMRSPPMVSIPTRPQSLSPIRSPRLGVEATTESIHGTYESFRCHSFTYDCLGTLYPIQRTNFATLSNQQLMSMKCGSSTVQRASSSRV